MTIGSCLDALLSNFQTARTESDLHAALEFATCTLGFSGFAMGHHVDLARPPEDAISLSTYSKSWVSHHVGRRYYSDDPIHIASTKTVVGFLWRDVGNFIRLTPRHKQILTEAAAFGLGEGFTVPVYLPGEYHGTCSFSARSLDNLIPDALAVAQLCGTFAFETGRRIMRTRSSIAIEPAPVLTERQHDALTLVGRGKTDPEIAHILGVSRATAHEHVEAVRHAYGNAQRPLLIARALFDGQVAFSELLARRWSPRRAR